MGNEDLAFTYDYGDYFKILPSIYNWYRDEKRIQNGMSVSAGFTYNSNTNDQWMTVDCLREWIVLIHLKLVSCNLENLLLLFNEILQNF